MNKYKVLVFGSSGLVGQSLVKTLNSSKKVSEVFASTRKDADLHNPYDINNLIELVNLFTKDKSAEGATAGAPLPVKAAATAEKVALLERLRNYLDETSRQALLNRRASEAEAKMTELQQVPYTIYIG